jgi:hypothetical protein
MHKFVARGIGITGLELTLGPVNCTVAKTMVSLLRFESPDSNPRGLAPLRLVPRVDLSGRSPVVCKALGASIDAKLHAVGIENFLSRARLMRLPGHLVLLTVDLSLYLTYDIRIGILPSEFGYTGIE